MLHTILHTSYAFHPVTPPTVRGLDTRLIYALRAFRRNVSLRPFRLAGPGDSPCCSQAPLARPVRTAPTRRCADASAVLAEREQLARPQRRPAERALRCRRRRRPAPLKHTAPAEDVATTGRRRVLHRRKTQETLAAVLRHVWKLRRVGEVDCGGGGGGGGGRLCVGVRTVIGAGAGALSGASKHTLSGIPAYLDSCRRCVARSAVAAGASQRLAQHGAVLEHELHDHEAAQHLVVAVPARLSGASVRRVVEHVAQAKDPFGELVVLPREVEERQVEVRGVNKAQKRHPLEQTPEAGVARRNGGDGRRELQHPAQEVRQQHVRQHKERAPEHPHAAAACPVDVAEVDVLLAKRPGADRCRRQKVHELCRQPDGGPMAVGKPGPLDLLHQLAELLLQVGHQVFVLLVRPHDRRRRRKGKQPCVPQWTHSLLFPVSCCVVLRVSLGPVRVGHGKTERSPGS